MDSFVALIGLMALIFFFWRVYEEKRYKIVRFAKQKKLLEKFSQFPAPTIPFIGHMWYFLFCRLQDGINTINKVCVKLESPFVLWIGNHPTVHLKKLEDIENVAKTCVNRRTYNLVDYTLGAGIFSVTGEKWKKSRRLLTPAFGPVMLTQYLQVFNKQSEVLVDLLHQKAIEGEHFDLWPFLINANLDSISENVTGIQSNCQRSHGNEFSESFLKFMTMTIERARNPLLYSDFVYKIYLYLTGLSRHIKNFHEYPQKAIREALKNQHNTTQYIERNSSSSTSNITKCAMDILLVEHIKDPRNMTEKQMSSEMIQLVAAGSETTAITNGLVLLMYGIHQAEQEAVYQEIKRIIPEDRPITMEDLNQLEYTEQTIKETLRFFSVSPLTYRTLTHPLTLTSGNIIPENINVVLHLRQIHENPLYYPNPNKWNPENFSVEAMEARPKNSFTPFGIGLRACLGSKYAMLSVTTQICYIVRKYQIFTDTKLDEIVLDQDILRRSSDGYRVKLRIRDSP